MKVLVIPVLVVTAIGGMYWSNSGREVLLRYVTQILQSHGIIFTINGVDRKVARIQKIYIRLCDRSELIFSNITLNRKSFFDRFFVNVDTFSFVKPPAGSNPSGNFMDIIPSIAKLKFFIKDLSIKNGILRLGDKTYLLSDINGFLSTSAKNLILTTKINLEDLPDFDSIPLFVSRNFKKVSMYGTIDCDFSKEFKCHCEAIFYKSGAPIGNVNCIYENGITKFVGNVSWINISGFNFSNLNGEIDAEKNTKICLEGQDFKIISDIKFDNNVFVRKLELSGSKGFLKSSKQFFITDNIDNLDCSFTFDFRQLDFWNKIALISGSGCGNFAYRNKALSGYGNFAKLSFKDKDYEFCSLNLQCDKNNLQLTAQNAKLLGMKIVNLGLKITGKRFDLCGRINEEGALKASGEISESFKKISFLNGKISFPHNEIILENCILDTAANNYKINCALLDKKKRGEAQISFSTREVLCDFKSFQLNGFMKLFNCNFLDCKLNGNLKLKPENENFIGEGKFLLSKFATNKQDLDVSLKMSHDGVRMNAHTKNPKEFLEVSAYLPINLRSDYTIRRNMQDNLLDCRMTTDIHLEKMLELPDNSDLRGNLISDFRITGNFSNPVISGRAQLQRAFIVVGNVLLKNGIVSLSADGGNIISANAEFVDSKKKKAIVSGYGQLFFDGIIPNIDTNLNLKFNGFTLFDSDDIKIDIKGEGCMKGPINSMSIQGKVVVPKCTIHDFTSAEEELDIAVENDIYLNDARKNCIERDFFKYDVSMHCPNIEFVGSIFKMHLYGDLLLSTYQEKGALSGELKLSDGKLDLFGKRMVFTSGKVTFLKEYPFDPKASLNCQRNFEDMSVGLDIENSPGKGVSLNLYSSPSYSIDMILSKMLFGKESKYLTVTEAVQLTHAIASLNQHGYIFSVLNTFQNIGVVDSISFASTNDQSTALYSNSQNTSAQNNINASAGKYIHDNVYISANKKDDGASFDIDFSITQKISIKANTKGEAGLSWKYRY